MAAILGMFSKKKTPEQVVEGLHKDLLELSAVPNGTASTSEEKVRCFDVATLTSCTFDAHVVTHAGVPCTRR